MTDIAITIVVGAECFNDREPRAFVRLDTHATQVTSFMVRYLDQEQLGELISDLQKTAQALANYVNVPEEA